MSSMDVKEKEMTLDLTKPLRTVEGHHPVRVHATDMGGDYPVLVTVKRWDEWGSYRLTADGRLFEKGHMDKPYIENVPEKRVYERWVNVYEGEGGSGIHQSRADADRWASSCRIACLHIRHEYEPGEGLKKA